MNPSEIVEGKPVPKPKQKYRQPVVVSHVNPFIYKERNRREIPSVSLSLVNTVFRFVTVDSFSVSTISSKNYTPGKLRHRVARKRERFRRNYLYPSIKKGGILDPLVVQFITNVPKDLGGFAVLLGNNRLRVIKESEDLDIEEVPCFVVNISGKGGDFKEPFLEGELINSEERAMKYYKWSDFIYKIF